VTLNRIICIPSCITHRPLPTHTKLHANEKNFLRTDGHALLHERSIRSTQLRSQPNKCIVKVATWNFLHRPDYARARFALNLARKDLRILVGLLTGHADLNHLCIMGIRQDSGCPLCQEEDDTTVHFIAQCSALMLLRKEILGDFALPLDTLSDIHWHLLLRFAKASKRFYRPWGMSGMRTGPVLWPQRWVSALQASTPKVKVRWLHELHFSTARRSSATINDILTSSVNYQ